MQKAAPGKFRLIESYVPDGAYIGHHGDKDSVDEALRSVPAEEMCKASASGIEFRVVNDQGETMPTMG